MYWNNGGGIAIINVAGTGYGILSYDGLSGLCRKCVNRYIIAGNNARA